MNDQEKLQTIKNTLDDVQEAADTLDLDFDVNDEVFESVESLQETAEKTIKEVKKIVTEINEAFKNKDIITVNRLLGGLNPEDIGDISLEIFEFVDRYRELISKIEAFKLGVSNEFSRKASDNGGSISQIFQTYDQLLATLQEIKVMQNEFFDVTLDDNFNSAAEQLKVRYDQVKELYSKVQEYNDGINSLLNSTDLRSQISGLTPDLNSEKISSENRKDLLKINTSIEDLLAKGARANFENFPDALKAQITDLPIWEEIQERVIERSEFIKNLPDYMKGLIKDPDYGAYGKLINYSLYSISKPLSTESIDGFLKALPKSLRDNQDLGIKTVQKVYNELKDPKKSVGSKSALELDTKLTVLQGFAKRLQETIKSMGYDDQTADALAEKFNELIKINIDGLKQDIELLQAVASMSMENGEHLDEAIARAVKKSESYEYGNAKDYLSTVIVPTVFNTTAPLSKDSVDKLKNLGVDTEVTPGRQQAAFKYQMDQIDTMSIAELSSVIGSLRSAPLTPGEFHPGITSGREWIDTLTKLLGVRARKSESTDYENQYENIRRFRNALDAFVPDKTNQEKILRDAEAGEFQLNEKSLRKYLAEREMLPEQYMSDLMRSDIDITKSQSIVSAREALRTLNPIITLFQSKLEEEIEVPPELKEYVDTYIDLLDKINNFSGTAREAKDLRLRVRNLDSKSRSLYSTKYGGTEDPLTDIQRDKLRANLASSDLSTNKIISEAMKYGGDSQVISQLAQQIRINSEELKQIINDASTTKSDAEKVLTQYNISQLNLKNYAEEVKQNFKESVDPVEQIQQRLKMIDTIISGIDSAINTVLNVLKSGLNVVHKTITTLGKAIAAIPRTLTRIVQLFGNLGNRVRSVNALTNAWVVLDSKLNLIERAYNAIFSNQYLTNVQQTLGGIAGLNQISGETANTIIDFAEAMEYAFGTPMSTMISQTSELALLMRSLGVQTENIANASLMISTVGLSLQASGILGGDYDAIMTKIVSGLRGETEAIADVGIDVRSKSLDELLAKIKQSPAAFGLTADAVSNLANSTSELTEKQLVNLRILAIYNQYVQNNGEILKNYAGYMDTVVGRVNGLKSAFTTLFSTVGVVVYQVVAAIGPYLEYIIRLITSAVSALAKLLGFETDWSELSGQMSGSFDSQTGSIQDNTEATEENTAAKNSNQGALASFDRITSIDSTSGSDSEADLSGLLSGLPNMNDLLDQYLNGDSRMDALREKWNTTLFEMLEKFQDFAYTVTGHKIDLTFGFNATKFTDNLRGVLSNLEGILKSIGFNISYYLIRIAEDLRIGKLLTGASEGLNNITGALRDVLQITGEVSRIFYEAFLSPIFKSAGESLYEWLTAGSEEFSNQWVASAESLAERLTEAMQSDNPWENFLGVISEEFPLLGNLIALIESVSKAIGSVWETVSPLIGEFGQFAQDTIIPYLADTFERMATYIDENRESIQGLLTALGEFAWDIVTTAIEGIGKVIDTIVTNKDLVMELLDGFSTAFEFVVDHPEIIALLIGGKAVTTVVGGALGAAETGLDIFSSLQGLGIIGGSGAGAAGVGAAAGAGAAAGGIGSIASALPVIGIVVTAIVSIVTAFSNNEELLNRFKESLSGLWESIQTLIEAIGPLVELILESIGKVWEGISPLFDLIGVVLANVLTGLINILGNLITAVAGVVQFIVGVISGDTELIMAGAQNMFDGVVGIFSSLWDSIVGLVEGIANSILNIFGAGKSNQKPLMDPQTASDLIASKAKGNGWSAQYTGAVWAEYTQMQQDAMKKDIHGGVTEDEFYDFLNSLPIRHAEGGIFSQPHYALFAEDGAEAVIPLSSKYRSKALPIFMQTAGILGFNLSDAITSQTSITSIPSIGSVQLPQINTGLDKQDSSGSDSIRDGIEEALFGVINQLISQGYLTKGGANNYTANTDSILRLLARLLAPYLTAQTSNISNFGFTIR